MQNGALNSQSPLVMQLDHATIVTGNLDTARRFLCSIIGLSEGPRPPFGVGGHWLYANDKPAIHLIEAGTALPARPASARIDHVALRIDTAQEWSALLERLRASGLPYELGEVPLTGEHQVFVTMAPGIVIELVTDQQPPTP
jgi:catechol 2,3-dioxygenase-like lactoylglutathione lyase family enzyme